MHKVDEDLKLNNIYKDRCKKFYEHKFFNDDEQRVDHVSAYEAFTFESLKDQFV